MGVLRCGGSLFRQPLALQLASGWPALGSLWLCWIYNIALLTKQRRGKNPPRLISDQSVQMRSLAPTEDH